jgi:hypothetical protein
LYFAYLTRFFSDSWSEARNAARVASLVQSISMGAELGFDFLIFLSKLEIKSAMRLSVIFSRSVAVVFSNCLSMSHDAAGAPPPGGVAPAALRYLLLVETYHWTGNRAIQI